MELLLNDLSLHGQFSTIPEFRESIRRIMAMRSTSKEYGRELYSQRNIPNKHIRPGTTLSGALRTFTRDEKASLLGWLTKHGPFWEDRILTALTTIWSVGTKLSPKPPRGKRLTALC